MMHVSAFLLGVMLYVVIGNLLFWLYRFYVDWRYPPEKFNGGFFIYLVRTCADPQNFPERLASIRLEIALRAIEGGRTAKFQNRIASFWLWPNNIATLYLYARFAHEKEIGER